MEVKKNSFKYILWFNWVIIVILLLGLLYLILFNPNSYVITINSVKVASEYQSLKNKEKDVSKITEELITANVPLYEKLDDLNTSIDEKYKAITEIQSNTDKIIEKLNENKEIHEQLITLELPEDLKLDIEDGYYQVDSTLQKFSNHRVYLQAQADYLKIRTEFETVEQCIETINYDELSDKEISEKINNCIKDYDKIIPEVEQIEVTYNESLTAIKTFIEKKGEKYKNSELLYLALAQENFEDSKKYHQLYTEADDVLKSLDVANIWFEYKENILDKLWSENDV